MAQPFIAKVVTANDLREGDVVYLTDADDWTRELAEAEILHNEATAKARLALVSGHELKIIGAYLVDVTPQRAALSHNISGKIFAAQGP